MNGPSLARRFQWLAVLAATCAVLAGAVVLRESGRDGGSDRCSAAVSCESDHATTISCAPSCSHAQFVVSFPLSGVAVLIAASLLARPMSRRPVSLLVRSRLERPPQRLT